MTMHALLLRQQPQPRQGRCQQQRGNGIQRRQRQILARQAHRSQLPQLWLAAGRVVATPAAAAATATAAILVPAAQAAAAPGQCAPPPQDTLTSCTVVGVGRDAASVKREHSSGAEAPHREGHVPRHHLWRPVLLHAVLQTRIIHHNHIVPAHLRMGNGTAHCERWQGGGGAEGVGVGGARGPEGRRFSGILTPSKRQACSSSCARTWPRPSAFPAAKYESSQGLGVGMQSAGCGPARNWAATACVGRSGWTSTCGQAQEGDSMPLIDAVQYGGPEEHGLVVWMGQDEEGGGGGGQHGCHGKLGRLDQEEILPR